MNEEIAANEMNVRVDTIVRPRLLDLFCCAGGAGMGYARAGFEVVGVDINPQPRYPFEFHQANALAFLRERGHEFDAIHASPPCQRYSVASKAHNGNADAHPDLVPAVRDLLRGIGKPWVIENVIGAPLIKPVVLCGTMFPSLRVIRHRQFESSEKLTAPGKCGPHPLCYTMDKRKPHYGKLDEMKAFVMVNGGWNCSKAAAADSMGIDWMTKNELNEAIPPAYTEYLGWQLRAALMLRQAA